MSQSEARVQQEIRIASIVTGSNLLRNNVGVLPDARGVPVRFGAANESKEENERLKSSDLIGWTEVTITPDMVGRTFAVYTSVEVKEEGWIYRATKREIAQKRWNDLVGASGGFSGFASNVAQFLEIVRR